jgi:hypothetical protein
VIDLFILNALTIVTEFIGIVIVIIGGTAIIDATTAAFTGTMGVGNFTDTAGLAAGLAA